MAGCEPSGRPVTRSSYCRVIGKPVSLLLTDKVCEPIACPEYEASTGVCRLKQEVFELDGGLLPVLLNAVTEPLVGPSGVFCGLVQKGT
jgi:hypothetical protein